METPEMFQKTRLDLSELRDGVARIKAEVAKVIVGQEQVIDLLVVALLADGHVLIEGVPGVAKTLTAKLLSRAFSVVFSRIQFTPDLMPSDVLGTSIFNQKTSDFEFKRGPIFSNIVLIDEINRAPAKTQSALFEAMEERQVTIDGQTYKMAPPFIVLATQNPVEHEGTYRLPEAQLDRFIFKVTIDYPSLHEEEEIIRGHHTRQYTDPVALITPVMSADRVAAFREKVRSIHVEEKLISYIARLVNDTRQNRSLFLGASPRASIAILNTAKALAAVRGRDFITPEDIREVTLPVMQHRVILTPEREMEGLKPADVIREIIQKIEVPR
jgi:MoxR-like ATPase